MEPKYALSQGNVKKKNTEKPGIFTKNRLQVALFQGKRDREDRGTLLLKFGEGCPGGGRNLRGG
jgi:hypothetical protein